MHRHPDRQPLPHSACRPAAARRLRFGSPNAQDSDVAEQIGRLSVDDGRLASLGRDHPGHQQQAAGDESAYGESMTGVPATTDMHFRNGAVAISMVATVLLQLVDEGTVGLDDTLATWLPDLPHARRGHAPQLAAMTRGLPDYVPQQDFVDASLADPFRPWTPEELIAVVATCRCSLRRAPTGATPTPTTSSSAWPSSRSPASPMDELIAERVLDPLGLTNTADSAPHASRSRCCTPSPPNAGRSWAFPRACRSTRIRRSGIRRGRSRAGRSRPPTSAT